MSISGKNFEQNQRGATAMSDGFEHNGAPHTGITGGDSISSQPLTGVFSTRPGKAAGRSFFGKAALALAVAAGVLAAAEADAAANDVVLLGAEDPAALATVKAALETIPEIGTVYTFNTSGNWPDSDPLSPTPGVPSLTYLQDKGAVLVWSYFTYADNTALGNVLANYYDNGGGVVSGQWEVGASSGVSMAGAWAAADKYRAISRSGNSGPYWVPSAYNGTSPHPILSGVASFTSNLNTYGPTPLVSGAVQVADFDAASNLSAVVATKPVDAGEIVDLGFYPVPISGGGTFGWSGDGARLLANALLYAAAADSGAVAQPDAPFPPAPFYLQTNAHSGLLTLGDWYSASTAGNGANVLQIHVPIEWPAGMPLSVDLLSPDLNNFSRATGEGKDGLPRDEGPAAYTATDTVKYTLYDAGATYNITSNGSALPAGGPGTAGYVNGTSLAEVTYAPHGTVGLPTGVIAGPAHGDYARMHTFVPTPGAVYVLRSEVLSPNNVQNGFRVAAGFDPDAVNAGVALTSNPNGISNDGDEVFISTPGQTLEHNLLAPSASVRGISFFRHVPPGQLNTRFHNFDFDGGASKIRYYAPGQPVDPAAASGGTTGTVSGNGVWNNGGTSINRVGDNVSTPIDGYWVTRMVVGTSNQFNLETTISQPMFAVQPPTPELTVTKTVQTPAAHNPAILGDTITFNIRIENTSDGLTSGGAYNVVVTDATPTGMIVNSVSGDTSVSASIVGGNAVFTFDNPLTEPLMPGDVKNVTVTMEVGAGAVGPTKTNNVVTSYTNSINDKFFSTGSRVFAVNKAPSVGAGPFDYTTTPTRPVEDTPFTVSGPGLLDGANDPENGTITAVVVTPPAHGTLVINSDGSFTYTPDNDYNGGDSFTFKIVDAFGQESPAQTVTLDVLAVNDPPVANDFSDGTLEDTPKVINVLAHASDPENDPLTVVGVNPGLNTGSVTFDPLSGLVTFVPAPDFSGGNAWFTYTVEDPSGAQATGTVAVWVTAVNDPPVAVNDPNTGVYTTNEDTTIVLELRTNDTDVDSPPSSFQVIIETQPANGTVIVRPDGKVRYVPNPNYAGADSFTYRVSDGQDVSLNVATVSLFVTSVNDAPVANTDMYLTAEDQPLNVPFITGVLYNDVDVDHTSTSLIVTIDSLTSNGTIVLNPNGSFVYTPDQDFVGVDYFTYRVVDPEGGVDFGIVQITVGPRNDAPVAHPDTNFTDEHVPVSGNVLANDYDADGDVTTATVITPPLYGTVTMSPNGDYTYTPNDHFHGLDTFTYQAYDQYSMSNVQTVTIAVTEVNDPPVAGDDGLYTVVEDHVLQVNAPGVLGNDSDADNDPLVATILVSPLNGTLVLNQNGSFTYTPDSDYFGLDGFQYRVSDGRGGSDTAVVSIVVTPRNDAPVAVPDSYTVAEDSTLNVPSRGVLINDTDVDGTNLALRAVYVAGPAHGTLSLNSNGGFVYTPAPNYNGTDTFTYSARDLFGLGLVSEPTTVTIIVTPTEDNPVAVDDAYGTPEDTPLNIGAAFGLLYNDSDVDGDTLTASLTTGSLNGASVTVYPDGSFQYIPAPHYTGTDSFTYTVSDSTGRTAVGTVSITVGPLNDAPFANPDVYVINEDQTLNGSTVLVNDMDFDGDPLTGVLVTGPSHAQSFTFNNDGTFTYVPQPFFNGTDSFTYQAFDGIALSNITTVTIVINSVNNDPVVTNESYSTNEDTPLTIGAPGVLANDYDPDTGDTLQAVVTVEPGHGTLAFNGNGGFTYFPNPNFHGTDFFRYRVYDGHGGSAVGRTNITINSVNDVPVAQANAYSTNEDVSLVIAAPGILANDSDADGDPLTAVLVDGPANGSLTAITTGGFTFTPNANWNGVDSFTYYATDGTSNSNTVAVTITVNPVNDVPVANNDNYFTNEDQPITVNAPGVLSNDVDLDGDTLSVILVSNTSDGSLVLNSDGSFTYTPNANWNGVDSFRYKVSDGTTESLVVRARIIVNAVPDVPVAVDDTYVVNEDTTLTVVAPGVLGNDLSPDGVLSGTAQLVTPPSHGSVVLYVDGSFEYVPYPNFHGTDSFTYQAVDAAGSSVSATVTLNVTSVEDMPVALPNAYAVLQGNTLTIAAPGVLADDTDGDGDVLSAVAGPVGPSHGALALSADGSFVYTPQALFVGTDVFTYFAVDSKSNSSAETTVTIVVGGVNHAPVATDDVYSTGSQGAVLSIGAPGVLGNDTDPDNDALTATLVNQPQHGVVVLAQDGSFTYTPFAGYSGADSFTYKVSDGELDSGIATVTINTQAVNGEPVANNDNYSTLEDTVLTVSAPGVLANDFDPEGGALTASLVTSPAHGLVTLNADGSFVYTPDANWNSELDPLASSPDYDGFRYEVRDADGATTRARVRIFVKSVIDQPVARNDNYTVNEDSVFGPSATSSVMVNDTFEGMTGFGGIYGPAESLVIVQDDVDNGVLDMDPETGIFTYTPNPDFSGTDSFQYVIGTLGANFGSDPSQAFLSNVATVTFTVLAVNDAPVAAADSFQTPEDTPITVAAPGVLFNDSDVDGDALTAILQANPAHGTLTLNGNGSFTYTPSADWFGTDLFTYYVTDSKGSSSLVATATIVVTPVNDAPVSVDDVYTLDEDTTLTVLAPGVLYNDTDIDSTVLTATLVSQPLYGRVVFYADGSFAYRADADYFGTDSFTYRSHDGQLAGNVATVRLTIRPAQDVPVGREDTYGTVEGTTLTITAPGVLANDVDVDGDTLFAQMSTAPSHGHVTLQSDGSFVYVPSPDFYGTDQFFYWAQDGFSQSNLTTVTITVGFVNDAPVARDDEYFVFEDAVTTVPAPGVLANDFDSEDDVLTASLVSGPLHGTLTLETSGSFVYTPNENFVGDDYFTYQASDGVSKSNVATVILHVMQVNDIPLVNPDYYSTDEEKPLVVAAPAVLANDFDADGEALTALLRDNPVNGVVSLEGDGSFVYTPMAGFFGEDTFTYTAFDGHAMSAYTTVTILVRPVNDAPVALDDVYDADEDTTLTVAAPGVMGNDSDPDGDLTSATLVSPALHGAVILAADGSFEYRAYPNYSGTDSFTYWITDGLLRSNVATVTIRVREIAEAPVADEDFFATQENQALVVAAPGILANDYDPDGDALTAILVSNPVSGTLALDASGAFTYTPSAGFNGQDLFTYVAHDGSMNSAVTTVTITVGAFNDAPVAADDLYYVYEGQTSVISAPGVLANDTDIDDAVLTATLVNPAHFGTVVLRADGGFDYTPAAFYNGPDSFTYQVTDGASQSNIATVQLVVLPVGSAPVANADFYSTNEEEALTVGAPGVLINDFDHDGEALTAVLVDNASSGTVALDGSGAFVYTPAPGFFGTDTFTYQATDGTSYSAVTTVTIVVRAVNDAPVARDDTYNMNEDTTLTVVAPGVLQNDTDQDGDVLSAQVLTQPLHGQLVLAADGSFVYQANPDYFGTDSFTYRAGDGGGLWSDPATVTIVVQPVQDLPVANPDFYTTRENTPILVPAPGVLADDTDADGDPLTAIQTMAPANGVLIFPGDGSFSYSPDAGFNGTDLFTYMASDGNGVSNVTTVTIFVGAVNDVPVAVDDVYNVYEDTVTTISAPGVLANDTDADDDALSATLVNGPLNGTVDLREDGSFTYTPYENYYGPDSFTYQATDGLGESAVATVTINVLPVDDVPLANEDYFVVDENQQLIVAAPGILGNDSDADGDVLTAILQAEPAHGQILLQADGSFVYTPDENFNGTDLLTYMANDGTQNSGVTTVTIVVRPRNERPVANDDTYEVDEDTTLTIAAPGVLANDTDSDDDALTVSLETAPLNGTVTLGADGSFVYTPRADYSGTDRFTYRAHDGVEASAPALVTIVVRPVNDLPVARDDNFFTQEDTAIQVAAPGILADDTDADGDALTAVLTDNVSSGVLVLQGDGSFIYTPNRNFSGVDTFTYRATDGKGVSNLATVTITVGVVNDVPVAFPDAYSLFEDTTLSVPAPGVLANDYDGDGDVLAVQVVNVPLYGALVLAADGSFTYTPMADFTGTDSFTYQATDGLSDSNITTVTLRVVARQDKPLANADFYSTTEDLPLVVAAPGVLGNDVDADGEILTALLQDNPRFGTVALSGDGSFVYTPEAGFGGTDTFTYRANDGHENSDVTTVTIRVYAKNDVPVSVDDVYFTNEDQALSVPSVNGVLANDYDLDGDTLTAVLINQPLHGSVVLAADGSFIYTPMADFNGQDYFIYRAYDGQDWSTPPSRVVINVRPVQDAPVAVADMYSVPEDKVLVVQAPGILGNDSDADGEVLTAILVDAPQSGVVALAASGGFVYTPDEDFFGTDYFTYYANDGTENSALTTVTISVGGRNDGPVAVDDLYYTGEDTVLSIPAPGILGNDTDDDGDLLQAVLITPPLHGTLALQPSGAFVYTPNANYSGEDRFVYRASDGTTLSNPATVRIIVTQINDAPVLSNVVVTPAVNEGSTAVLTADLYDADPADTFLVTVNWGDGTAPTVQSYPAGTSKLFLTHLYADDNPTATAVDTNAVSITVQDNNGGADTVNRQVVVSNLNPSLENVTLTQVIPTGGTARLQGQITDIGVQDTFLLGIWWGDGQTEVHYFGAGGLHNFDFIHTYATPGYYEVTVGVMDDDGGIDVGRPTILVRNTADLVLSKTANPDPASVGELVTYTMIVQNNGPDLARNVILMDTIPSNVDVISASPEFVKADGVLNWFLGDMASGQRVRVDLVVKTRQQGPVQNVATVVSDELDPVPGNNTATVVTTIGWLPDGPDLQAQAVTLDTICKSSKYGAVCTLKLWALVANRGNRMANANVYSAYLSVDNILSPDDMKLFTKRFPKLKPGQVKGQHQSIKAPAGFTSTGKFLIVVLDEGNLVFEGNETNNLIVQGPLP